MSKAGPGGCDSGRVPAISVQRFPDNRVVVRVSGSLDGDMDADMRQHLTEQLMGRPDVLVLDLSEVSRIDADALGTLIVAAALAGEPDIGFCLVAPQGGPVRAALAAAGATEVFEIFASVDQALREVD